MAFDAKSCISIWILLVILSLLFWYRLNEYDKIFAIYAIMLAVIMLILYGVHSSMDPLMAGRITIGTILVFIAILIIMSYTCTGKKWIGVVSLIVIFIVLFLLFIVVFGDYRIDISYENNDPPYWFAPGYLSFIFPVIFIGLLLPLIFILANENWAKVEIYIAIVFMIVSVSILFARYKNTQAISVWFYTLTIMVIFFWVVGMFERKENDGLSLINI